MSRALCRAVASGFIRIGEGVLALADTSGPGALPALHHLQNKADPDDAGQLLERLRLELEFFPSSPTGCCCGAISAVHGCWIDLSSTRPEAA